MVLRNVRPFLIPAILGVAVMLASCAPPGSDSAGGQASQRPVGDISTNPATAGQVTLNVWDQEVRGGQNAQLTQLNKEFQAKYPNVKIVRTSKSFSDLKTTLRLALSGANPPDVVQANQGYPDMVTFVKAGMLTPMDSYSSVYGWEKRYPKTLLDLNRVSSDAKKFGTGRLYGISQMGEYIGIYYNKATLASLGLKPPTTWAEFTASLATIKAKGQLPIQFGNLDKYPAIHTYGMILDQLAGKEFVRDLVFGTGKASWTDPRVIQAATTLQTWAKSGYLTPGANGLGYDDASKQFAGGKGVYLATGTWAAADLKGPMGAKFGLIAPPPAKAGGPVVTTGGESLAMSITSKSKNPDVAAAYLNFITNPHAADVMTKTGNLPAVPGPATAALTPASPEGQLAGGWKQISDVDGLAPYLDYSTPTFYDTITASLQSLIGGQTTPQQFGQALQADYAKFHQS